MESIPDNHDQTAFGRTGGNVEHSVEYNRGLKDAKDKRWRPPKSDPYHATPDVTFHEYRHGYVAGLDPSRSATSMPVKRPKIG